MRKSAISKELDVGHRLVLVEVGYHVTFIMRPSGGCMRRNVVLVGRFLAITQSQLWEINTCNRREGLRRPKKRVYEKKLVALKAANEIMK